MRTGPCARQLTVILKASDMCNGACSFCSVGPAGRGRMSAPDFELFADALARHVRHRGLERLQVTFHGGEPTLLGAEWLDRACARLRGIAPEVVFAMQSNLLAVSDELLAVVREHDVKLGTSIDPLFGERRDAAGRDAFPAWLDGFARVDAAGIHVGAIFVVTRAALPRAADVYRIAESLAAVGRQGFGIQINPVYPQGRAAGDDDLRIRPEEFGAFLVDLWRCWEESGRSVSPAPIPHFAEAFAEGRRYAARLSCMFRGDCAQTHLGVDHDLNVAGCGRRLDSRSFLGNLRDRPLEDILESAEERRRLEERTAALRRGACAECGYFDLCHGGCPDDAELATGDVLRPFPWCRSYRMLFEALDRSPAAERAPRSRRAQPAPRSARALVQLAGEPDGFEEPAEGVEHLERWLLPTPDGRAFRFDSPLARCAGAGVRLLRVWLPNSQVPLLSMWEDLLGDPRTRVVLGDADGLDGALEQCNAMRATVLLDVLGLLAQAGGEAALGRIVGRFLHDPGWRSQIHPFADMLSRVARRVAARPATRWQLEPGGYAVAAMAGAAAVAEPPAGLLQDVGTSLAAWTAARRPCLACPWFRCCGGQFAAGDGDPCPPAVRALVREVALVGDAVRDDLEHLGDAEAP